MKLLLVQVRRALQLLAFIILPRHGINLNEYSSNDALLPMIVTTILIVFNTLGTQYSKQYLVVLRSIVLEYYYSGKVRQIRLIS